MSTSEYLVQNTAAAEVVAGATSTLGYTPTESLVAVAVTEDARLGLIARVDLAEATSDTLAAVASALVNNDVRRVVVVAFSDDADQGDRLAIRLGAVAQVRGVKLAFRVRVSSDGYRVDDERTARPLDDLRATVAAAQAVASGHVVRENLMQTLPGQASTAERRTAEQACAAWLARPRDERRAEALSVWARAVQGEASPEVFGHLAGVLADKASRDAVLISLIPGAPATLPARLIASPEDAEVSAAVGDCLAKIIEPGQGVRPGIAAVQASGVLAEVIAHVEDGPAAWGLWGLIAWWCGQGPQAAAATGRALSLDPDHRLSALINRALIAGMAPGWAAPRK